MPIIQYSYYSANNRVLSKGSYCISLPISIIQWKLHEFMLSALVEDKDQVLLPFEADASGDAGGSHKTIGWWRALPERIIYIQYIYIVCRNIQDLHALRNEISTWFKLVCHHSSFFIQHHQSSMLFLFFYVPHYGQKDSCNT